MVPHLRSSANWSAIAAGAALSESRVIRPEHLLPRENRTLELSAHSYERRHLDRQNKEGSSAILMEFYHRNYIAMKCLKLWEQWHQRRPSRSLNSPLSMQTNQPLKPSVTGLTGSQSYCL